MSPFKSQAQRRFMFSQHPKMAEEFAKATPKGTKLPEKVAQSKAYEEAKKSIKK